ncbi:MAG: hypothetical protein RL748_131 [Pseudomonadota bacterium]|jgi:hypothetical protein
MEREFAIAAKAYALNAVASLSFIAREAKDWEGAEMQELRRAVGLAMGRISTDILEAIYKTYPDLDDLE